MWIRSFLVQRRRIILNTFIEIPSLCFANIAPTTWKALGELPRTGWVRRGVKNPESVQEHILDLRRLAHHFNLFSESENKDLLDMLEIHDWPEAIHGDEVIVVTDNAMRKTRQAAKFEKERDALTTICDPLGDIGATIFLLWIRFETSEDEVASFARQLDKYQAIEKALEYEKSQGIIAFKDFRDYSIRDIKHEFLLEKINLLSRSWETHQLNSN
jgi:putative hydrolase of HD superfamily